MGCGVSERPDASLQPIGDLKGLLAGPEARLDFALSPKLSCSPEYSHVLHLLSLLDSWKAVRL